MDAVVSRWRKRFTSASMSTDRTRDHAGDGTPEPAASLGGDHARCACGRTPPHHSADVVELSRSRMVAPSFLCKADLQALTYCFAWIRARARNWPPDLKVGATGCRGVAFSTSSEAFVGPTFRSGLPLATVVYCILRGVYSRRRSSRQEALQQGEGRTRACWSARSPDLSRDETLQTRSALAEAWFLQDDIRQAPRRWAILRRARAAHPARLSSSGGSMASWPSPRGLPRHRAARALAEAGERAHTAGDRASTHYESASATVTSGTPRSSASTSRRRVGAARAGDPRNLALVHCSARRTRRRRSTKRWRRCQAERLAMMVRAGDVVAMSAATRRTYDAAPARLAPPR